MSKTSEFEQAIGHQADVLDNAFNRARKRRSREREERIFSNTSEDRQSEGFQGILFELDAGIETNIEKVSAPEFVTVGHGLAGELSTTTEVGNENEGAEGYDSGSGGAEQ